MELKTVAKSWCAYFLLAPQVVLADKASIYCLADNIYYEARGEPVEGQLAVAQVVVNRHKITKKTVCEVVYEPYQFSWTLKPQPLPDPKLWQQSYNLAKRVVKNKMAKPNFLATHYHNLTVAPDWAHKLEPVQRIHNHQFYYDRNHRIRQH